MKKSILLLLVLFSSVVTFAQDKITTKDNQVLTVYIIEKNDKIIKYKMSENQDHTVFTTKLSNLRQIEYANGMIDMLGYQSLRMQKRFGFTGGISLFLEEGGMFTGSVDYFLSPNVDLELNIGSDGWGIYRSLGAKLYLTDKNSKSSVLPYVGLLHGSEQGYQFFEVPVGVSYMTKCGFQTSLQLSSLNYYNVDSYGIHAELKLGWRF